MEMPYEDPLSEPPWSTIIICFIVARIVLSVVGIILNGCNCVIICKLPETCGNHFRLIQSLATADMSLCLIDLIMLATNAYYNDEAHVIQTLKDILYERPER